MHFDLATAMLVTSLLTLSVGGSLAFATSRYPANLRAAMTVWIGGLVLQVAAMLPVSLQWEPTTLLMIVSNAVYALAFAEMARALYRFAGQPHRGLAPLLLVALVALVNYAFSVAWPQPRIRIASTCLLFGGLQFAVALPILRGRSLLRHSDYLTGSLFLACGIVAIARAGVEVLALMQPPVALHASMREIFLVFGAVLPTLGTIGFMLMCGDRLNGDLARLAMVDPLTGVYNRRTLAGLAEKAIDQALHEGRPLSLLALDVDHFKRINDQFGHDVGDDALRGLVALIQEALPHGPILSRIGGEEFAVLIADKDEEEACELAERVRRHIERTPVSIEGRPLNLRVSIGVASLDGDTGDLGLLLRDADRALYSAKRGGRNRVAAASRIVPAPVHVLRRDIFG